MKRFVLLFAVTLLAAQTPPGATELSFQESSGASGPLIFSNPIPIKSIVYVTSTGKTVLTISLIDGTVTFGAGLTPDEATRQFIAILPKVWPQLCQKAEAER